VRLSLNIREVGEVTVIRCSGRIVAGPEAESLRKNITKLTEDRRDIVLHLGEVVFVDSSGLGMLVRLLTSARRTNGDLKLCNVAPDVHRILKLTNLLMLFDTHKSEEDAVSAFYQRKTNVRALQCEGPAVLCIDESADVLAYLRELLRSAGYRVLTSSNLPDALILIRATRPGLIIVGPSLRASAASRRAFESICTTTPVVELGDEFSSLDAGNVASELLEKIRVRLDPSWIAK